MISIYHNPRCSKSRQTLALLEDRGLTPNIILYLDNPPDSKTLKDLLGKLGITELWNADKKMISPGAFRKAEGFLEKNTEQATLAFGGSADREKAFEQLGGALPQNPYTYKKKG